MQLLWSAQFTCEKVVVGMSLVIYLLQIIANYVSDTVVNILPVSAQLNAFIVSILEMRKLRHRELNNSLLC